MSHRPVKRRSGRRDKPCLPWFRRPWKVQGPFASDPRDRTRPEWCNIVDANGMFVVEGIAPAMAALIVNAVNFWDEGDETTNRPAVVDPSYIGRRVDAVELVEAIRAGMRLRDKGECKVGGLWVFRDDPILPDPGQPGVIRISTVAPDDDGEGSEEEEE